MNEQDDARAGKDWLDRPANVTLIFRGLIALCVLLAVLGFFVEAHGELAVQHFPVFYGLFGFIAFIFIVFAGKALRKLVMRDEDYYER